MRGRAAPRLALIFSRDCDLQAGTGTRTDRDRRLPITSRIMYVLMLRSPASTLRRHAAAARGGAASVSLGDRTLSASIDTYAIQ